MLLLAGLGNNPGTIVILAIGLNLRHGLVEPLLILLKMGDDRIQKAQTGYVQPDAWTHGSSAERKRWFATGFNTGDPAQCNTFAANALG